MEKQKLDQMVSETQQAMAKAVDAVKDSQTKGEILVNLAQAFLPEGDPMLLFTKWITENSSRLREALAELGLDVEEGPGFVKKLREVVTPILVQRYEESQ